MTHIFINVLFQFKYNEIRDQILFQVLLFVSFELEFVIMYIYSHSTIYWLLPGFREFGMFSITLFESSVWKLNMASPQVFYGFV